MLHIGILILFYPASSLFETQHHLTPPLVMSSNSYFQEDAPFHSALHLNILISFIVRHPSLIFSTGSQIPWYKVFIRSSSYPIFRALHLDILFSLYLASFLFETQHQLGHLPGKSSSLPLRKFFKLYYVGIFGLVLTHCKKYRNFP